MLHKYSAQEKPKLWLGSAFLYADTDLDPRLLARYGLGSGLDLAGPIKKSQQ
jgi:hypothetical protein